MNRIEKAAEFGARMGKIAAGPMGGFGGAGGTGGGIRPAQKPFTPYRLQAGQQMRMGSETGVSPGTPAYAALRAQRAAQVSAEKARQAAGPRPEPTLVGSSLDMMLPTVGAGVAKTLFKATPGIVGAASAESVPAFIARSGKEIGSAAGEIFSHHAKHMPLELGQELSQEKSQHITGPNQVGGAKGGGH